MACVGVIIHNSVYYLWRYIDENVPSVMESQAVSEAKKQCLFIMRHGDRLDTHNSEWKKTAARPYDTPLTGKGEQRALKVARDRYQGKVNTVSLAGTGCNLFGCKTNV